jgi:hypothetical protein
VIGRPEPAHVERALRAPGITAAELLAVGGRARSLTAAELERWLLDAGLATNGDGLLRPTALRLELGAGLAWAVQSGPGIPAKEE